MDEIAIVCVHNKYIQYTQYEWNADDIYIYILKNHVSTIRFGRTVNA